MTKLTKPELDTVQAPPVVEELSELSARLGIDITLVQGGGGNVSVKSSDVLWVKASGFWLAQATEQDIFVPVALSSLRTAMASGLNDEITPQVLGGSTLRPSIETTLHAALPHPVVIHVHSANAIAWSLQPHLREKLDARLKGLRWAWVPYARPGVPLTKAILQNTVQDTDVLILANHGLVLGAATCSLADDLLRDIERRLALDRRMAPAPDRPTLSQLASRHDMALPTDDHIHGIATDFHNAVAAKGGPLYPDHCVFLGMNVPVLMDGKIALYPDGLPSEGISDLPYLLVPGLGVLVRKGLEKGALAMLRCWSEVLSRTAPDRPINHLSGQNCAELLGWEAEDYRKKLPESRSN